MTQVIDDDDLRGLYPMKECIAYVERAYEVAGHGGVEVLPRETVTVSRRSRLHSMTAGSAALGFMMSLSYSGGARDTDGGPVDERTSVSTLFSIETRGCEAVLIGRHLAWLKTGAVGAVAIKYLADPAARTLAVVGTGHQARAAIRAAVEVRELDDIRVVGRRLEGARVLARELAPDIEVRPFDSVREAVAGADIVCTVTTSASPVLKQDWLVAGVHVNAIGAHHPTKRELGADVIEQATVFVDDERTARAEKGELLLAAAEGRFDWSQCEGGLASVVAGRAHWARGPREQTIFCSSGTAVEGLGAAVGALDAVRMVG